MTNELVSSAIASMASFIESYAVTLSALGALTMALLEAYKKLFSVQGSFQRLALQRWLLQGSSPKSISSSRHYGVEPKSRVSAVHAAALDVDSREGRTVYSGIDAYDELLLLTTGVRADIESRALSFEKTFTRHIDNALFELDLALMMGQVQDAADAALNNPNLYPHWFAFLTRGCKSEDIGAWLGAMQASSRSDALATESPDQKRLADIYGRIRLLMRRQLDSFQTVTAFRWRELNQLWAIIVGAVLMFIAQFLTLGANLDAQWAAFVQMAEFEPMKLIQFIVVSLLGGVLSPVAKDLVDALGKVKSRV